VDAGVTLRGRVLDASTGLGIAGADVGEGWIAKRRVQTEFDGSFVFEGFATDGYYDVSVRAAGYGGANVKVRDPDGPFPESLEVRLQPGRAAHGRIVDSHGAPIAGAYVGAAAYEIDRDDMFAAQQLDWLGARSGEDGRFRLVDLRADLAHALHVRLDGFGAVSYAFPPNERELLDVDLGDVVLRTGALVRGRVVDERGEPVPAFVVQLVGWNADRERYGGAIGWALESYLSERATRTDDLGRFAFADVAAGDYDLLAVREGSHERAKTPVRVGADASLEPPRPIDLVVPAGLSISGRVVDRDGKPVVANVSVDPSDPNVKTSADLATRADGSFVAVGLAAGEYSLSVYPHSLWSSEPEVAHHARAKRAGVAAGSTDVELVVERALALRGRVVDARGAPAGTVEVVARRDAADPDATAAIVTPDGRFTLWLAEGVRFDLEATVYVSASPGRLVATERTARLEGVLAGGDELELRLP
ncbi:MAG: carboxypeptidase regulatory-like domain-containing protein, partial [Planctomycetes bacterium]|nr:carboxypeptidase regulatory-like domain-containing protein [Planctomycetota bacterium]